MVRPAASSTPPLFQPEGEREATQPPPSPPASQPAQGPTFNPVSQPDPDTIYTTHEAYLNFNTYVLQLTCKPTFGKAAEWVVPYVLLCNFVSQAAQEAQNQYGMPDTDAFVNLAFNETKAPYSTLTLCMPIAHAATMQAMMGGQPEAVIADDKVHITLVDQTLQSWHARADEARREEIEQARAAERHRINQTLRKIVVKPNHCLGIPPLTLARAQDMLHSHFSQVAEVGYMQQHVNGVPVLGVHTHSIAAWVGPPLGGGHAVPQLLRDSEVSYAKWEYYFAVPDPDACSRCHQTWTPCALKKDWRRCSAHLYFKRQRQRQHPEPSDTSPAARRETRQRHALTPGDIINATPAMSRARARSNRR